MSLYFNCRLPLKDNCALFQVKLIGNVTNIPPFHKKPVCAHNYSEYGSLPSFSPPNKFDFHSNPAEQLCFKKTEAAS